VVLRLAVGAIVAGRFQPRRRFDEGRLKELAESIKTAGVMQPVLVRRGVGERYELVAGERRWRAAQLAGLAVVPAVVAELSDREAAEWGLIENVQREDLGPMEKAEAFAALHEKFGLSHGQVAERVGIDRVTVTNLLRLRELEDEIKRLVEDNLLSVGHAKVLAGMRAGTRRVRLARAAAKQGWSVRKLDKLTADEQYDPDQPAPGRWTDAEAEVFTEEARIKVEREQNLRSLEDRISGHLGVRVKLRTDSTGKRGRLVVPFRSVQEFDVVMKLMGIG
jgi:ParB family transcriptional regulator, chromosome partitioning protein